MSVMDTTDSADAKTLRAMLARFQTPGRPAQRPLATFVAGQMGSGKTSAANALAARLPPDEAHVVIDGDAIAQMDPRYHAIESTMGTPEAQRRTLGFASKWQSALIAHAAETGAHLTIEVAPARTDLRTLAFEREISGYETKLAILAVPEHESRQAIFSRYANEVRERGSGRAVTLDDHDTTYAEWSAALARAHADGAFGSIEVISNRRAPKAGPQTIDVWTRREDGSYDGPPEGPVTTLTMERVRPVAAAERFVHARRWGDLAKFGVKEAFALQRDDADRLASPAAQRLKREARLAGNADARANGTGKPSRALTASLAFAQSKLSGAIAHAAVNAASAPAQHER